MKKISHRSELFLKQLHFAFVSWGDGLVVVDYQTEKKELDLNFKWGHNVETKMH